MSGYDKQLIWIIFYSQSLKMLFIPGFSRTATKIQGLSRAWSFLLPIPGLYRISKDRGNSVTSLLRRQLQLAFPDLHPH